MVADGWIYFCLRRYVLCNPRATDAEMRGYTGLPGLWELDILLWFEPLGYNFTYSEYFY